MKNEITNLKLKSETQDKIINKLKNDSILKMELDKI